jgi:hypothetical protein
MKRGKSIRISPASTPLTQASTTADDIVNVFIFSSLPFSSQMWGKKQIAKSSAS